MRRLILAALAALVLPQAANAWTRPGHMVSAAIAWREIAERRPDLLPRIGALLSAHPDRAPFQVAIDRTTGVEQARRQFLQCARWPDDARGTAFDHPTWHLWLHPVAAPDAPDHSKSPQGDAVEAFALAYRTLASDLADPAQKAQALCWVLHVGADIHQPLHTAQLFSGRFPKGDGAGGKQFVKDPLGGGAISLHWLWDDSIHRSGEIGPVDARAAELRARLPRADLPEARKAAVAADFPTWAEEESLPLARSMAYGITPQPSAAAAQASAVDPAHWTALRVSAERRLVVASYRLADLVIAALGD